jgi:hypothetical protein
MNNKTVILTAFNNELTKISSPIIGDIISPAAKNIAQKFSQSKAMGGLFHNALKPMQKPLVSGEIMATPKPQSGGFGNWLRNKFSQPANIPPTQTTVATPKPQKSKLWGTAKGVLGGAALGTGIIGAGTVWGGLTMEPGMNASFSGGEGPSAQGPVYGA